MPPYQPTETMLNSTGWLESGLPLLGNSYAPCGIQQGMMAACRPTEKLKLAVDCTWVGWGSADGRGPSAMQ